MNAENMLKEKVVAYLKHLDITGEQSVAYLVLLQQGPQTVLALSRNLKTGRTKLYPLLEDLATKQLITVHERHYGTSYEAQSPDALAFLVQEKIQLAEKMRSNLPAIQHALSTFQHTSPSTSKIIEYRGVDGLKQMNFNLTKAKKEFRVFEIESLSGHLGARFAEKLHEAWAEKHIASYDLTNNPTWKLTTQIETYQTLAKVRYINPKLFRIEFETYIYNNCVALLSYEKDDIFGVEVYNKKLARQQIQLFDLVWRNAQPITSSTA
jgi:sugar-specific transcriptional regulator TrmB